MKFSKLFALVLLLDGFSCFGQTAPSAAIERPTPPNPGYTISVAQPASDVQLGSPINITITIKNISSADVFWRADAPDTKYMAFRFLLSRDGSEVETTFFHRKLTGRQRPSDPLEVWSGSSILAPLRLEPNSSRLLI